MFNIFKFFRKEVKNEIKEDEVIGVYPPLKVKLKSDQEIRLEVIEKVLNDMPDNVKDVFNMLSKKGVDTIPAYESGCSFVKKDINVVITNHSIHLDYQGVKIYSKWYDEDISLFSTYLCCKTLKELWDECEVEREAAKELAIKKAKSILTTKPRKKK